MSFNPAKLKNILTEEGILTPDQLSETEAAAAKEHLPLEEYLVNHDLIKRSQLEEVAKIINYPYIDLTQVHIPEDVIKMIPELVAREFKAIPFAFDRKGLKVAMANPEDSKALNALKKRTEHLIIPYYALNSDIESAINNYHKNVRTAVGEILKATEEALEKIPLDKRADSSVYDSVPTIDLVNTVIEHAFENRASDIHFEPHHQKTVIRFRIDGILHDVAEVQPQIHDLIIARIKVLASLRPDVHMRPQDGKFLFETGEEMINVRISIIPVTDGEKVVCRLLSSKISKIELKNLGLHQLELEKISSITKRPYGLILATGPTGSGKTTTLYALLHLLNTRERNICTIEDPIEYDIEGINQIQVKPDIGLDFSNGLRHILRQDPDVVMVGEIRDVETAKITVSSALTGHVVLSTLHTNDAPTALPRLLDMGVKPYLVAATVMLVIAQRLVRKVCHECSQPYTLKAEELRKTLALSETAFERLTQGKPELTLYRGSTCNACGGTGYKGRTGIFEMLEINEEISSLVLKDKGADIIRETAINRGMTTMLQDGVRKALAGVTTIDEVLRVTEAEGLI